jgi:hypothetical protein
MFIGDGITRHLDGSPIEAPIIQSESVSSDWTRPKDVAELLSRVHSGGAPSAWIRFFGGEETEEQERARIRTALDGHKYPPDEMGRQSEPLARIKNRIENDLRRYAWLDSDHEAVVNPTPEQLAPAVSARAALDLQLRSINILLEQNAETERARVRYASDMHLLWTLADAIVNATPSFSDRFAYPCG